MKSTIKVKQTTTSLNLSQPHPSLTPKNSFLLLTNVHRSLEFEMTKQQPLNYKNHINRMQHNEMLHTHLVSQTVWEKRMINSASGRTCQDRLTQKCIHLGDAVSATFEGQQGARHLNRLHSSLPQISPLQLLDGLMTLCTEPQLEETRLFDTATPNLNHPNQEKKKTF